MKKLLNTKLQKNGLGRKKRPPFVRPYESKLFKGNISFALLTLPLFFTQVAFSQEKPEQIYKQELSFVIDDILFNEESSVYNSNFKQDLTKRFKGKLVNLKDVRDIKNKISAYYKQELNIPQVKILMNLPATDSGILRVTVIEPFSTRRQTQERKNVTIEAISFSGKISIDPDKILNIANQYTGQNYSLITSLKLRKELMDHYKNTGTPVTINIPEFDVTTGDLYIHLQEGLVKKLTKQPQKNINQEYHEVSHNIFLHQPAPKQWKEPKWLTQPAEKVKKESMQKPKKLEIKLKKTPQSAPKKKESKANKASPSPPIVTTENIFASTFRNEPEFIQKNGFLLTNRTEDDLLILELNVDGKKLSTGIETYYDYTTEELFLPLGSLSKSLNFPMNVQSKKGKMSGFFLDPENTFELNASEQTIKVADKKLTYPQKGIEFSNTEIFATPENIAAWFPLQIKLIYAEQRLEISSLTELPFQAYAKRRGIWENLKEKNKPKTLNAPTKVLKRGLISEPHIYGALNQVFTKSTKNEYDSNTDLNLQATADILQMTGHFNAQISHSDDTQIELDEVKATLTQVDSNGKLLGFLKSTQFELGDVDFQTPPLLSTNSSGRGVFVSNKDINAIRDPDNFVLTGNAPAGWDVEVYQNGLILDFQEVENNGSYSFTALPLKAGQNTFNVKIYGPNGEQEEYVETYFLGSETIKKGEFNYDFIATESSQDLISTQKQESSGGLISLSTEYGLLRNLSVTGGLFAGEIYRKKTEAATLGLRTALWGTDLRIDYISQKNDPSAYQINLRRNLSSNTDISLNHLNYKNYDAGDNPVDKSFGVTLNHNFSFKFNPNIQTQISYEKEQLLIGTERDLIKTRVGTQIYGINLTNELDATIKKDTDTNYNGTLSASAQFNNIDFRTRASYQIENEDIDLSQVTLGLNGQIDKNINLRSSITQAFEKGLDTTNIDSQISWRIKQADIGFNIGGNSEGNIRAGFNLSSHFVPESAGYKFKNSQIASYGGVQVDLRAFLDDNNNKIFDEGEKVLENTIFHYKKRGRIARTNSKGIATLTGLTPYIDNIILVDLLSIKDIYIKPINEKVNVVGEPYQQGLVDFPMRLEGELGGTIKYIEDIDTMPLSGIRIKLKNMNDVTIAETISEFDGYFLFTNIPMGSYTLNLNKQDLEALNRVVSIETPKVIKLNKDQPFKDGFDVLVKAKTSNSLFNETILKMQKEGTPKVSQLISTP